MITIYANWTGNALASGETLDAARAKLTPLDCQPETVFGTDPTDVTALDTGPHIIIPPQPDRYDLLHKARPHFAVIAAEGPARLTMDKDTAIATFRRLVQQHGLQWTAAQNVPKADWDAMTEAQRHLTAEDRRAALGLPK